MNDLSIPTRIAFAEEVTDETRWKAFHDLQDFMKERGIVEIETLPKKS